MYSILLEHYSEGYCKVDNDLLINLCLVIEEMGFSFGEVDMAFGNIGKE